ncbi:transferase activity, transferring phosphorus-containing groups protein [[Candida] boidinii]|uniref:Unnamed protein product n=1 Tax=Candida boidinii TaxID=5477 RepID=A0ACB5TQH4_CANBO|nr:transferase activity, transferring phosphorus-containing groups protein [[Candida] boidinii]OWB60072.1 transferase activity, transferring phosphorus-containing groups protein [[Candida] boidinii]OWB72004.1 transferase activity, transferring phosphorus-containing groups protein [[Candida] boidinii]GME93315.1 unnamed protein product [[Candida] boidinii]
MSNNYNYLDLVKLVDSAPYVHETDSYNIFTSSVYTLISHDSQFKLGYVLPIVSNSLKAHTEIVSVDDTTRTIKINSSLDTVDKRIDAFAELGQELKHSNKFETLKGWRNELYTIYGPNREIYMRAERALCPLLGVVMYGVHINGYIPESKSTDGKLKIWVPRRSATKPTYPGMLDNTVAGGLGYPYGPYETVIKECYEEAGLEEEYVKSRAKSAGCISYLYQLTKGKFSDEGGLIQPEVEYVYDLMMDEGDIPHPVDDEAEDFKLMDLDEIKLRLSNGEFKHNCASVIIDFLIRHSYITPENEADYLEVTNRLHRFLPFPTR